MVAVVAVPRVMVVVPPVATLPILGTALLQQVTLVRRSRRLRGNLRCTARPALDLGLRRLLHITMVAVVAMPRVIVVVVVPPVATLSPLGTALLQQVTLVRRLRGNLRCTVRLAVDLGLRRLLHITMVAVVAMPRVIV